MAHPSIFIPSVVCFFLSQRQIYVKVNQATGNNTPTEEEEEEFQFIKKKLDEIGFRWTKPNKITQFFPQMMDELKQYKKQST